MQRPLVLDEDEVMELLAFLVIFPFSWIAPIPPRSLPLMSGAISMAFVCLTRLMVRLGYEPKIAGFKHPRIPVLIAGAGVAGSAVARELRTNSGLPYQPIGFLDDDPSKEGLFVYRLKMPAGYRIPPHLHKASENVTVLSGLFFIGSGEKLDPARGQELPVGAFVSVPPNHPHYAWAGDTETVVQVHGVGPTDLRFVNPEDDPRRKN